MRRIKKAREPPPASCCFAHYCNLAKSPYTGQVTSLLLVHTQPMTTFNFQSVQCLDLQCEDNPSIDVKDGRIVLTAQRGEERIIITSPLSGLMPGATKTYLKAPARAKAATTSYARRARNQGQKNPISKLTEADVLEIRELAKDSLIQGKHQSKMKLYEELAQAYRVNKYTIKNVVERISWTHI